MSISTYFKFVNENDPEYQKAINGSEEQKQEWENKHWPLESFPGKVIECDEDEIIFGTDAEYGDWIIPLDKIPAGTTHISVYRS